MAALRQQHSTVGLRLEVSSWRLLHQRLLAEDIEFFVADVRDLPADPKLEMASLGRQSAHFFARVGHPLAAKRCTVAQAWRFGVAATKLPQAMEVLIAQLASLPAGEEPMLALECDDVYLLRSLAQATDTVIAASDAAVDEDVRGGSLVRLKLKDLPEVYAEMGIATLVNRMPSPMAQRAIACVRDVARRVNV